MENLFQSKHRKSCVKIDLKQMSTDPQAFKFILH